ncbi:DNA methyltransferase [Ruegeria phage RpAliso]|nr:DNA methyltransferase [Ruegeria phage RpAliso]
MGKRSDFERVERDYYQTPQAAVVPLIPFLPAERFSFIEPCAGDGRLIRHVRELTDRRAQCHMATDIQPDADWVSQKDALDMTPEDVSGIDMVITNPPWDRRKATGMILHRLIQHFAVDLELPTWFLFDSDWVQTVQARQFMPNLLATVSIGRVKWIEGSKMTGKDNCQWHLFHPRARELSEAPLLFGRNIPPTPDFGRVYDKIKALPMAA